MLLASEYRSITRKKVWEVMHKSQVPKGKKILGGRLVLRTKRDQDGKILRRKARWVVKGYVQRYGKDYEQTFAGVCKSATWKIAVALAARFDLEIEQTDVDTAFLENDIDVEVYVKLPPGWCENGVNLSKEDVCKLSRALYGLKQSPRLWQKKFRKALQSLGFEPLETDQCIFINKDTKIIIVTYVDDCLIISKDNEDLSKLKYELQTKFTIEELGPAQYFLGVHIHRDRKKREIYLGQDAYTQKILSRFGMTNCHTVKTPCAQGWEILMTPYEEKATAHEIKLYH
jgi:hypothetical protein